MMLFGTKLKEEREQRGWSQEYLAEKIHVSRQSVSKWETNKNYPNIEIIIDLSNLFGITIDELLRSDKELKDKIIKDSNKSDSLCWSTYLLMGIGILIGIIIVSTIKHGEMNLFYIARPVGITAVLLLSLLFIHIGVKRVISE